MITPVILCGGSGTRLWPRSRAVMPKPFLPLVGDKTLFEATLHRAADPAIFAAPIIVTGSAHLGHVEAQLGDAAQARIIVEPAARNTAAAIALAAVSLPDDAVMLVPEVKIRPRVDGVEAIIEFVSSILAGAVSVHQLHAPEIEIISADAGRGIWALHDRLIWPTGHPGPLGGTKFDGSGHYHEVYRRTAKGWRIAELRLSRLYTERA